MYLTILMPCLNEEKTLGECILNAKLFLKTSNIKGEILIVDNGSIDNSVKIAKENGARVIIYKKKGYGNAIKAGIKDAKGDYIIMGDCDMSYDFSYLDKFIEEFNKGNLLVVGNRYKGGIKKGAMPFSHKYIGVPILSFIARKKYNVNIHDFHCGLRGFCKNTALRIDLVSEGMEFATEIICKFALETDLITEVPIILSRDKREGNSHLRALRDGFRHLNFIIKN